MKTGAARGVSLDESLRLVGAIRTAAEENRREAKRLMELIQEARAIMRDAGKVNRPTQTTD